MPGPTDVQLVLTAQIYGRDLDDNGDGFWSKVGDTVFKGRAGLHKEVNTRDRYATTKQTHAGNATVPQLVPCHTLTATHCLYTRVRRSTMYLGDAPWCMYPVYVPEMYLRDAP